jgi:hypothetical protein
VTRRVLRGPAIIVISIALVAASFAVRLTQPSREDRQAPFIATAVIGQAVEGRDLVLTPEDVYLADRITTSSWVGETEGVWLVIDATIGSRLEIATPYATMTVGALQYTSSDRPDDAALGGTVAPGLPQSGSFVFELPESVIDDPGAGHAVVRFATAFQVRLDSAIELSLDLTSLRHESSVALQDPGLVLP